MRIAAAVVVLGIAGPAAAQGVMMPANADLRAMQAPIDYEGSRNEAFQEKEHIFVDEQRPLFSNPFRSTATASASEARASDARPAEAGVAAQVADGKKLPSEEFAVEIRDAQDRLVETIARSSNSAVARAAFKEAAKEKRGMKITLRRGDIVVASKTDR